MRRGYGLLLLGVVVFLALAAPRASAEVRNYYAPLARRYLDPAPPGEDVILGGAWMGVPDGADSITIHVSYRRLGSPRLAIELHSSAVPSVWSLGPTLFTLAGAGPDSAEVDARVYWPGGWYQLWQNPDLTFHILVTSVANPAGELAGPFSMNGRDPARPTSWGKLRRMYGR